MRDVATTENSYDNDNDVIRAHETNSCIITAVYPCLSAELNMGEEVVLGDSTQSR